MKAVKVPQDLVKAPYFHRDLQLNGLNIVESCTHTERGIGTMFLQEPLLLVVLRGTNTISYGNQDYVVRQNEMVLLKKSIQITYHKVGDPAANHTYDSLMFFIKEEFIKEFVKMAHVESVKTVESARITIRPINPRLRTFCESIQLYFAEPESVDGGLIRLKMLELLYDLSHADPTFLQQLLQLKQQVAADIPSVMEANYANPISLTDLAYLSGRSLSSFKRDFYAIYQTTPAQWIREKRLLKAKELLSMHMAVTDVCYSLGFENVAHFSRLFKAHYGKAPSSLLYS